MADIKKILITGGGSEEPIDNVRSVCNFSTGRTSSFIAESFAQSGFEVTALMAEKAIKPENCKVITYRTFAQLKSALETQCKNGGYSMVIQAAAVSDYSPETVIVDGKEYKVGEFSKLPAGSELTIKMRKNPKLVDSIKENCGKNTVVVAFKLTSNASPEERKAAVQKIFCASTDTSLSPDFVVSNDLSEIKGEIHPCRIFDRNLEIAENTEKLSQLAEFLQSLIK